MQIPLGRTRLVVLAKAALGLVVLAALLEITARLSVYGIGGIDPFRLAQLGAKHLVTLDTTPSIAWEYKPNLDRQLVLYRFRTNQWGLRDEDYPLEKRPGTFRVAVIGSSHSVPAGVEIEDAYHSVLEREFSAESSPRQTEFLNFAVGLHLPSQFVAMIQQRALRFDPDLIIVSASPTAVPFFFLAWSREVNPIVIDRNPPEHGSTFLALARFRLGIDRREIPTPRQLGVSTRQHSVIHKLAEISRTVRVPIVVARLELDPRPPNRIERRFESQLRANGIYYVDTRHAFAGKDPRELRVHELDPHPNARAHAIYADVIGEFLRREGLLEVRTRRGRAAPQNSD